MNTVEREVGARMKTQAQENLEMMRERALEHAPELAAMLDEAIRREHQYAKPQ